MPPKARITKDMIVDAAFNVVRRDGADDINVRKVANELGCSTQPVMYHFKTVEDLKNEVYGIVSRFYGDYLLSGISSEDLDLMALGKRYLQFASEEGNLFKFIFQSGRFKGDHFEKMFGEDDRMNIIKNIGKLTGMSKDKIRQFSTVMFSALHGYASIIANKNSEFSEETAAMLLETICKFSLSYWKSENN